MVAGNRPAAVAGTWYPGTQGALTREVDGYLADVEMVPHGRLDAIVAPHAGIMFSGPIAAHAYKAAAACGPYDAAILVGPSHFVAFDGVALYPSGAFESPLGPASIDEAIGAELRRLSAVIVDRPQAHGREHSLEMQLPFLKRLLPDLRIVPLLMGFQTRATIEALADALSRVAVDCRILLVASSDLSHYLDAAAAATHDSRVTACAAAFDAAGLLDLFEQYPEGERGRYVACGGGPIISVMRAARDRGAREGRVLKYGHSGEVSGDNSGVVGYLAAAFGAFTDVH
jgi:AmmeMemoRadiSam system protein B